MGRRRRKSSITSDTAAIANALPWRWALGFGLIFGALLYWAVPAILAAHVASIDNKIVRAGMAAFFAHRSHWFERLGVAVWLICVFFAAWNAVMEYRFRKTGERRLGWLGRVLSRWFD